MSQDPQEYDVAPPPVPPPRPASRPAPAPDPDTPPGKKRLSERDERMFAMLCHLLGVCGLVVPFGNIIGPLVMWLVKREDSELVDDQGKEAVNWQITVTIAGLALMAIVLVARVHFIPVLVPYYGLTLINLLFIVQASIAANRGERYRYPSAAIRLIK